MSLLHSILRLQQTSYLRSFTSCLIPSTNFFSTLQPGWWSLLLKLKAWLRVSIYLVGCTKGIRRMLLLLFLLDLTHLPIFCTCKFEVQFVRLYNNKPSSETWNNLVPFCNTHIHLFSLKHKYFFYNCQFWLNFVIQKI